MMALMHALDQALDPFIKKAGLKQKASRVYGRSLALVAAGVRGGLRKGAERYLGSGTAEALAEALELPEAHTESTDDDKAGEVGSAAMEAALGAFEDEKPSQIERLSTRAVMKELELHKSASAAIPQLRSALTQIIKNIKGDEKGPPIFVFVDELDRCNPQYAISLLEEIKHLFDVPGVVFVLGMEPSQLCKSIEGAYGAGFDAAAYLERLINYRYSLRPVRMDRFIEDRLLREPFPANSFAPDIFGRTAAQAISVVFNMTGRTLREADRILEKMRAAISVARPKGVLDASYLAKCCTLKYQNRASLVDPIEYGVDDVIISESMHQIRQSSIRLTDFDYVNAIDSMASRGVRVAARGEFKANGADAVAGMTVRAFQNSPETRSINMAHFYRDVLVKVAPFDPDD